MKKVVALLICFLVSSTAAAYPVKLDYKMLETAKTESVSVGKYDNDDVRQYSYMLGEKDYSMFTKQAPILIDLITPYSLAKYRYYKEATVYQDFTEADKQELISKNNIVKIVTRCHAYAYSVGRVPLPVKNVVIKKDGVVYKPLSITQDNLVQRGWRFPIELFDGSSDIEIIVIDYYDNVKPLKVSKENLADIK